MKLMKQSNQSLRHLPLIQKLCQLYVHSNIVCLMLLYVIYNGGNKHSYSIENKDNNHYQVIIYET